jgi:hypothetical protein
MLAEVFILRLEATLRTVGTQTADQTVAIVALYPSNCRLVTTESASPHAAFDLLQHRHHGSATTTSAQAAFTGQ